MIAPEIGFNFLKAVKEGNHSIFSNQTLKLLIHTKKNADVRSTDTTGFRERELRNTVVLEIFARSSEHNSKVTP